MSHPDQGPTDRATTPRVTLEDLLRFIQWMEQSTQAADRGHPLPEVPDFNEGAVRGWAERIRGLDEATRQMIAQQAAIGDTLRAQEEAVGPMASPLSEHLAALYDYLGRPERAQAVRMRTASLYVARANSDPAAGGPA